MFLNFKKSLRRNETHFSKMNLSGVLKTPSELTIRCLMCPTPGLELPHPSLQEGTGDTQHLNSLVF